MGGAITNNAAINIQVGFPGGSVAKNLPAKQETPVGEILWRKKWQPTPVILPKKSHGQRSLEGYSPWGHKRAGHNLVTKQQQQNIQVSVLVWKEILFLYTSQKLEDIFNSQFQEHQHL